MELYFLIYLIIYDIPADPALPQAPIYPIRNRCGKFKKQRKNVGKTWSTLISLSVLTLWDDRYII